MKKAKWFGVAALALCSAAGVGMAVASTDQASADQAGGGRAEWRARGGERLVRYLGLSEEQQAQWKSLRQQQRDRMKPLMDEGRALRQKLHQALGAAQPDARAVGEATIALAAHREKLRAEREQFRQQLAGILDAQQKQKLEAFEQARRTMGRGHGGRGMGPAHGDGEVPLS